MNNQELGKYGEDLACKYLREKGYQLIERNWRFHPKEVDIIAKHPNEEVIFVEVKTRSTDFFQSPADTISQAKQQFLTEAATAYIEAEDIECDVYFDLITIYTHVTPPKLIHIEKCFTP